MSVIFHPLRVRAIEPDTQEAVIISFDVPPGLRDVFGFTQGQYLTLRKTIEGQDLRRSYSICAGADDGDLRVGVRRVAGGVFSTWVNTALKAGDTLVIEGHAQIDTPEGIKPIYADVRSTRYRRSFALSSELDTDQIEATMADGVLNLRIHKRAESKPRKIEVATH